MPQTKVRLKDVKGLMVDKKSGVLLTSANDYKSRGFNEAIDQMSERALTMNREKLANVMWKRQPYMRYSEWEMKEWADSIILALPELLEKGE